MGAVQRRLRGAVNPLSTRATVLWQSAATRRALRGGSTPFPWPTRQASGSPSPPVAFAVAGPVLLRNGRINAPTTAVPDVVGLAWDVAVNALHDVQLTAVHPDGPAGSAFNWSGDVVTAQQPAAGLGVPRGSSITLWVGRGPGSAGVREPRRPKPGPLSAREALAENRSTT